MISSFSIILEMCALTLLISSGAATVWALAQRRGPSSSIAFLFVILCGVCWSALSLVQCLTSSAADQLTLVKLQYIGIVGLGPLWLIFVLDFTHQQDLLPIRRHLLAVIPVISLILIFTNEWHHLYWTSVTLPADFPVTPLTFNQGPWFWVLVIHSYLALTVGMLALLRLILNYSAVYRRQALLLLIGALLPWIGNFLDLSGRFPIRYSQLGVGLAALVYFWTINNARWVDLVPVARDQLIDTLIEGVIVVDRNQRVVDINPSAQHLLQITESDAVGQPVQSIFGNWDSLTKKKPGQSHPKVEITRQVSNRACDFELQIVPLAQNTPGYLVTVDDITERKRSDKRALDLAVERARVSLLERFIQDTSHDFRTPISAILSSAYVMGKLIQHADDNGSDSLKTIFSKLQEKIGVIHASGKQLEKIIEDMLESTRLEQEPTMHYSLQDLNRFLEGVVRQYESIAEEHDLTLTLTTNPDIPAIPVDIWKLNRVFQNLLDNAIHYTQAGGSIKVKTRLDGEYAVVEVQDTGIGIQSQDLPRIFDRFYRADPARSLSTGGTGLGLSIAKSILTMHQGRIEVQSTAEVGTTFLVYLPTSR